MVCYAYLCMVCSDIDMCNADVYAIFDYPFVQNTNVNDQTILLNIKFMLFTKVFWNDYDVVCITHQYVVCNVCHTYTNIMHASFFRVNRYHHLMLIIHIHL